MKLLFKTKSDLSNLILSQCESVKDNYNYFKRNKSYMSNFEFSQISETYKKDKETLKTALANLENLTENKINNLIEIANVYTNKWVIIEKIAAA